MRALLALALVCVVGLGWAQDQARLDRVWRAAETRMTNQGDIWFEDGDFPRVVRALRLRLQIAPGDYEMVTDLGWMLENIQQYGEALAVYREFRRGYPQEADAPFPEAQFWYRRKSYAKVPALLEPSLSLRPHPNSYRTLAHSYERMGLLEDSKRVWSLLIDRFPGDQVAKNNRNRVERKLNGEE